MKTQGVGGAEWERSRTLASLLISYVFICCQKHLNRMQRRTLAILALYFLSPLIGEMVSGSSPPSEFFTVFGLIVLPLLYGGGALIVRELSVIWGKGWMSVLLMGLAYGVIEEGLMVKSFFDPGWVDIGILGEYGRSLGGQLGLDGDADIFPLRFQHRHSDIAR